MNIKKGDTVKIIAGNDKGKQGKVTAAFPKEGRILVDGLNLRKRHRRSKRQGQKGEMVSMPASFSASRAMLVCSSCGKQTRAGFRLDGAEKVRICRKCGKEL